VPSISKYEPEPAAAWPLVGSAFFGRQDRATQDYLARLDDGVVQ